MNQPIRFEGQVFMSSLGLQTQG